MSLKNRNTLKEYFNKGKLPASSNFHDLIDSVVNKVDDGMSKTMEDGLMLSAVGNSEKLISFFKNIEDRSPAWNAAIEKSTATLHYKNTIGEPVLSLEQNGNVGIKNPTPAAPLDVNGFIASHGRKGTAYAGKIPADGKWHTVADELNGCHLFEVVAGVGKKKTGRYAMVYARALSTYGKSKNSIKIEQAHYGIRLNKIQIRWSGDTYNYKLEMRTRSDYNGDFKIQYQIAELWQDTFMDGSIEEGND
ncbi:hypothetical protein [Persicobacter diffluens]|uniref:Adhesin n=1 Tax=Persicobacter diffluens TaxID=981 RepID=A0AAN4W0I4_9BACT|nr:hypothetical protein PEDI_40010 [Persicobacter diffluens]